MGDTTDSLTDELIRGMLLYVKENLDEMPPYGELLVKSGYRDGIEQLEVEYFRAIYRIILAQFNSELSCEMALYALNTCYYCDRFGEFKECNWSNTNICGECYLLYYGTHIDKSLIFLGIYSSGITSAMILSSHDITDGKLKISNDLLSPILCDDCGEHYSNMFVQYINEDDEDNESSDVYIYLCIKHVTDKERAIPVYHIISIDDTYQKKLEAITYKDTIEYLKGRV